MSIGWQAGGSAGQMAVILMNERTLHQFRDHRRFTLDADAGLTIVNYSSRGRSMGAGDIVFWSNTEGAYAGASSSAATVVADEDANHAYYGTVQATPAAILSGTIDTARSEGHALRQVLGTVAAKS